MKQRIKTTEEVNIDIFKIDKKEVVFAEVTVLKNDRREYIIEGINYTENENGIRNVLRSKHRHTPYPFTPKVISYEAFDGLVAQFEQIIEFPEFPTTSDKIDYLALMIMLMINNGQIPDIGETETNLLCGVNWEFDTDPRPQPNPEITD